MATDLQMAGSTARGAVSGGMTGAKIGSMVPGVGTAVGAGVGALVGGAGALMKEQQAKKADEAIAAQDPAELGRLAEIDRIRKSIGAGTDPLTQQAIRSARETGAATQTKIGRATGGDVGSTIAGLTRAQKGTQGATNQALSQSQSRLPFFENLAQQLRTRISQRALEVGLLRRDQAMAERAQAAKERAANISGALGMMGNKQELSDDGTILGSTDTTAGTDQNGNPATSAYKEGNQVDIPIQSQMPIWTPSDQAPVVSPGQQSAMTPAMTSFNPLNNSEILPTSGDFTDVFGMQVPTAPQSSGYGTSIWNAAGNAASAMNTAGQNIDALGNMPL